MPQLPQLRIFNTTSISFNAIRENKTLAKILNIQVIDLDSGYFDSCIAIGLTTLVTIANYFNNCQICWSTFILIFTF